MLPKGVARKRGVVETALVIGVAKLEDCTTPAEAADTLTRVEMMAYALLDARGIDRLAALRRVGYLS